jgi:hypothetical protein
LNVAERTIAVSKMQCDLLETLEKRRFVQSCFVEDLARSRNRSKKGELHVITHEEFQDLKSLEGIKKRCSDLKQKVSDEETVSDRLKWEKMIVNCFIFWIVMIAIAFSAYQFSYYNSHFNCTKRDREKMEIEYTFCEKDLHIQKREMETLHLDLDSTRNLLTESRAVLTETNDQLTKSKKESEKIHSDTKTQIGHLVILIPLFHVLVYFIIAGISDNYSFRYAFAEAVRSGIVQKNAEAKLRSTFDWIDTPVVALSVVVSVIFMAIGNLYAEYFI